MPRFAVINTATGVVENVILMESSSSIGEIAGYDLVASSACAIGDVYDGTDFTSPEKPSDLPQTPLRVTMRQARLALHAVGLLSQVEAAIDALPEPSRTEARIEWDFSSEVFRERDFVLMLGASLGLTSEQMDDLFITAAAL